jgi:hypothetical protein
MIDHIKVHLSTSNYESQIDFWYDPPQSLWRFHKRTKDELIQELSYICRQYLHVHCTEQTRQIIRANIEHHINQWVYGGWLSIDPFYEKVKQAENIGDE